MPRSLTPEASERIPLVTDERGIVMIAGTRVTLDCVVDMFDEGASPEAIAEEYDSLRLDDVYAVITYYLRHPVEVKAYLAEQEAEAEAFRTNLENLSTGNPLRERLLRTKHERRGHSRP